MDAREDASVLAGVRRRDPDSALSHSPPSFIAASEDPRFRNAQADVIVTFWLDEGETRGAVDFVSFRIVEFEAGTAEIHRLVFSPSTDGEGFDTLTFSEIAAVPSRALPPRSLSEEVCCWWGRGSAPVVFARHNRALRVYAGSQVEKEE